MVQTGLGEKNIFMQVDHMQLADIHHKSYGYFGLTSIGNVVNSLPNPLIVSYILNLATSAHEVKNLYDRVRSYRIAKAIEGSITITCHNKLRLHCW